MRAKMPLLSREIGEMIVVGGGRRLTWLARLSGHDFDLQAISELFSQSSSPACYITKDNEGYYLNSQEFEDFCNATKEKGWATDKATKKATELLAPMNGLAKLLSEGFQLVQPAYVVQIADNGTRQNYVMVAGTVRMQGDLSGEVSISEETVEEHQLSSFDTPQIQEWMSLLENDPLVKRALALYGGQKPTWKNLYMVLDVIIQDVGGEKSRRKKPWWPEETVTTFKWTANSFGALGQEARHGKDIDQSPDPPMTLAEAKDLIRQLLRGWLQEEALSEKAT